MHLWSINYIKRAHNKNRGTIFMKKNKIGLLSHTQYKNEVKVN